MSCDHPDIEEFIDVKKDLNRVTKANISVRVTDKFMQAVENNEEYELKFTRPETGETISKTINAHDLMMRLAKNNWEMGEPGVLFWDRIENWNLMSEDDDFHYTSCNPCLSGDMELLTTDGYKKFRELDGQDVDIYNVSGNVSKSKVWCTGEKETVRVKIGGGNKDNCCNRDIVCTPDHRFMTVDGDECVAKDLAGKRIMPCSIVNTIVDDHFVKLGFMQGDGTLSSVLNNNMCGVHINVGFKDKDILDLFSDDDYSAHCNGRTIYVHGYNDELKNLGFSFQNLPERCMPESYYSWDKFQKSSFLQGCYSANGSVIKHGRIAYKTTCRKFAEQLADTLIDDFGINAYITTNKAHKVKFANGEYKCRESYDVNIGRFKDITKFMSSINFYQQYKREQLTQMIKRRAPYVYSVEPNGVEKVYDFTESERHWGIVEGCIVHNCGEEPLPPYGSCNLGSINLSEFVKPDNTFDYDSFCEAVRTCVRGLNAVLDEGVSLHPLQAQRDNVNNWRQIGLGIFGLADMLIKMGIRYGSKESIELCDKIALHMSRSAIAASCELAYEHDKTFDKFDRDSIEKSPYLNEQGIHSLERIYNSQLLTIPPCGSIATMLGVSGGIEPIFANFYERKTESLHGKDVYYKVYTPIVQQYMEEHGLTDETELPDYFVTAPTIDYKDRIAMQAIWQQHIDASISSTINLPNETTPEDILDIYMRAWKAGLKGVTVFRDGCKRAAILSTHTDHSKTEEKATSTSDLPWGSTIEVNDNVVGKKRKLITGCGSLHCTAFFDPITGSLQETYLSKGSNGGLTSKV